MAARAPYVAAELEGPCAVYGRFFGLAGSSIAVMLTAVGAAYATARSGTTIAMVGMHKPDLIMRSLLPVVLAGMIAISGMILGVIIANGVRSDEAYSVFSGAAHFGGGVTVGAAGLVAGICIGVVGEHAVRTLLLQPRFFFGMMLILIFCEVLGLYGLVIGVLVALRKDDSMCVART